MHRYHVFAAALSVACLSESFAGGFQLSQQSPISTGRALGGVGVAGDDLADIFFNPAGATLYSSEAQVGGVYLVTDNRFDDEGSFVTVGGMPSPATGPSDSIDETALTPSFYYVFPRQGAFSFGIAVAPTFGLGIDYDRNWVGRYHGVESDLRVIDVNPVVAYQVSPHLSLGAGLVD